MRKIKKLDIGVSPTIGATLILAVVLAGFVMISVSSFQFFDSFINENADASFEFEEVGDNKINITMTQNQNLEVARAVMPSGDKYEFYDSGDSELITIKKSGTIEVIGTVESTGEDELVATHAPTNIRAIEGRVFYNPGAEDVEVELEKSGKVILTQLTESDGSFSLVPPNDAIYDINVEDADKTVPLVSPGSKGNNINITRDIIDDNKTNSDTVADFIMDGNGTESNPYKVETIDDLQAVRTDKSANYTVTRSIDANITQDSTWDGGFEYIGTEPEPFAGSIETTKSIEIKNLDMNRNDVSIFENVTADSTIDSGNITATDPSGGKVFISNLIVDYDFPSTIIEGRQINGNVTVGSDGNLTTKVPTVDSSTRLVNISNSLNQKTLAFTLNTFPRDIGSYDGKIELKQELKTTPVDIILPENASEPVISKVDVPKNVSSSTGSIKVEVEFLNTGPTTISGGNVTIDPGSVSADPINKTLRDLSPKQSQLITHKFSTKSSDEGGPYTMEFSGPNSTYASRNYTITSESNAFIINDFNTIGDPLEGEEVIFNVNVTSTLSKDTSKSVSISSNDINAQGSDSLYLKSGETGSVRIRTTTVLNNFGFSSFTASTSDSLQKSIYIGPNDSGGMTTEIDGPTSKRFYGKGNSIDVNIGVRNDGNATDTPELSAKLVDSNGTVVAAKTFSTSSLSPGSKNQYSASFGTNGLDIGEYDVISETANDTGSMTVGVQPATQVSIKNSTIQNPNDTVTLGGTLRVDVGLINNRVSTESQSLSVETSSSNSKNSRKFSIKPSEKKQYRVPLQISESETTGSTKIKIVTNNDQISRYINITSP